MFDVELEQIYDVNDEFSRVYGNKLYILYVLNVYDVNSTDKSREWKVVGGIWIYKFMFPRYYMIVFHVSVIVHE